MLEIFLKRKGLETIHWKGVMLTWENKFRIIKINMYPNNIIGFVKPLDIWEKDNPLGEPATYKKKKIGLLFDFLTVAVYARRQKNIKIANIAEKRKSEWKISHPGKSTTDTLTLHGIQTISLPWPVLGNQLENKLRTTTINVNTSMQNLVH